MIEPVMARLRGDKMGYEHEWHSAKVFNGAAWFLAGLLSAALCMCGQSSAMAADSVTAPAGGSTEQPAQQGTLEEVVVTGYAASLKKAIEVKRQADVVSDGIAAEDIGEFPQTNLAEALQHVTGVEITRSQGEGQNISVRGLDPKFTDVLYNGRELPAGTGTRVFDFRTLSGDFANEVDVYKSPTADMLESGLAATVNVQTIHPLDYGKEKFAINAQGIYDDQAKGGMRPNISALFTDAILDNKLGVLVGFNLYERNTNDEQASSTGGLTQSFPYNGVPTPMDVIYGGLGASYNEGTNERKSAIAALQFRPNDVLEIRLDTLISNFVQQYDTYNGPDFWPGANAGASPVTSATINSQGVATDWSGSNVFGYATGQYNYYSQNLNSTALGTTLSLGAWKINGEVSYGYSAESFTDIYLNTGTLPGAGASLSYEANNPLQPVSFQFTNGWNPLSPANYQYQGLIGYWKEPTSDAIKDGRLDATRSLSIGWINSVQFGANAEDQVLINKPDFLSVPNSYVAGILGTGANGLPNIAPYFETYNNTAFPTLPPQFLTINIPGLLNKLPLGPTVAANPAAPTLSSTTNVEEKSLALYGQLHFADADNRLKGNVGVRLVRTEEISAGYGPTANSHLEWGISFGDWSDPGFQAISNSYNNFLPDLNVSYNIADNLIARFAAARVMQRPDLNLLAAASSPNLATQPPVSGDWLGTIAQGNPNLKPYLSNQLDLSLEWYINDRSLLSAALFLKQVQNFVLTNHFSETLPVTLTAVPSGSTLTVGQVVPALFSVSEPINAQETTIKGAEFGYQQGFTFLPSLLKYLGAEANYTHLWAGELPLQPGGVPYALPGVSTSTYNLGLYYDDSHLDVHALYNYRSSFLDDALAYFGDGTWTAGYGQLDMSGSYKFSKNIALSASVLNLTNEPLVEYNKFGVNKLYELSGRHYSLGVRVTL
jgi:iron complex outermembrane recepter protein